MLVLSNALFKNSGIFISNTVEIVKRRHTLRTTRPNCIGHCFVFVLCTFRCLITLSLTMRCNLYLYRNINTCLRAYHICESLPATGSIACCHWQAPSSLSGCIQHAWSYRSISCPPLQAALELISLPSICDVFSAFCVFGPIYAGKCSVEKSINIFTHHVDCAQYFSEQRKGESV